ncbi:MAG: PEP-CTERM sorting domain-containing protein [Rubrivivax sp.]|nr:PEP-CTERM sorting domain-containing protein [Rubrivivax sp.]
MSIHPWTVRATVLAAALVVAGHAHAARGIVDSLGPTPAQLTPMSSSVDVDLTGFEVFGSFTDPSNTTVSVNIGAGSTVVGFEFIGLTFVTENGSWQSELVLSVEHPDGFLFGYMDLSPSSVNAGGTFGPASGAWGDPGLDSFGAAFDVAGGFVNVYAYDIFNDPGRDALITGGTLRIFYQPIPEPSTYGLMALGLAGLGAWVRRRKTA